MKRLVSHIEFLLHHHNCVIIPGFGGFVVNAAHSYSGGDGVFYAPACELVFNSDLTYNDGLMAQSYMRAYQMSFDSATLEIENGVREMKHKLHDHRHVELGQLGSLTMQDNKRFVYASASFIRPAFFGLSKTVLKPLALKGAMNTVVAVEEEQPKVVEMKPEVKPAKIRITSIGAAAVALVAIMLLLFSGSDASMNRQSARMLSETEWFRSKSPKPAAIQDIETVNNAANLYVADEEELIDMDNVMAPAQAEEVVSVSDVETRYYIVLGVFSSNENAQKMTDELNSNGFSDAGCLERKGRTDVYVASFADEATAKVYLKKIHSEYPAYSDAWMLKR